MPDSSTHDDPAAVTMSFGDHLEELRKRLLLGLAVPLPLFVVIFLFSNDLVEIIARPVVTVLHAHGLPADLQALSLPEVLMAQLKLSMIAAIVISAPWILYQAWLFVAPGLYRHERRFVYFLVPGSAILTVAGVALLYWVMLPMMLHVLVLVGTELEIDTGGRYRDADVQAVVTAADEVPVLARAPEEPEAGTVWLEVPSMSLFAAVADGDDGAVEIVRIPPHEGRIEQSYRIVWVINFVLVLLLGVVIAFQMPLVLLLMGWLGLVDAQWLREHRRYALGICGVISAVVTPADAISLIIMLVPLYGLYELGILLLVFVPASKVADGRLIGGPRADKTRAPSAQSVEPAQADGSIPREPEKRQSGSPPPDEDGGG